ncbi:MAG TPA: cell division protein FtsZ [Anaerolineales bacterium]|nr:cell division protein FtsZ [Anaerolineales bacterium]
MIPFTSDPQNMNAAPATAQRELAEFGQARIKVIGLGGGGCNAIDRMVELGLIGASFIAANTDCQALASSLAPTRVQLGPNVTRGLGSGGDPRVGAAAALESSRELAQVFAGADMVFLTAGMGGGTGTGAAPIAAEIAREAGAVVIATVTMPFGFEMSRRSKNAVEGVKRLQPHTHTLITIPNDRLLEAVPRSSSLDMAFRFADDVLRQGIQGIVELVTKPGLINVDFAHVRSLMQQGGGALMAIGLGEGEAKASMAVHQALHHPLLEVNSLEFATGALLHFTGGDDLSLSEVGSAVESLRENLPLDVDVVLGVTPEPTMEGRVQVILVVTGIGGRPVRSFVTDQPEPFSIVSDNLDVPAFLRKRSSGVPSAPRQPQAS